MQEKTLKELCDYMMSEHKSKIKSLFASKAGPPGTICQKIGYQGCKLKRNAQVVPGKGMVVTWHEDL